MLVEPGGRERTLADFAALVAAAGLRLERHTQTAAPYVILDCAADRAPMG